VPWVSKNLHPERDRDPFSRFCTAQPAIRVKDNDNNMKTIGRIFSQQNSGSGDQKFIHFKWHACVKKHVGI